MSTDIKLKILFISSMPLSHSAGLGIDIVDSLILAGHSVDFLTREKETYPGIDIIYTESSSKWKYFIKKLKKSTRSSAVFRKLKSVSDNCGLTSQEARMEKYLAPYPHDNGIILFYPDERYPEIPVKSIIDRVDDKYDLIITSFWQHFINSTTLATIQEKANCPIVIYSPDMAPITGGCHYFHDCTNFITGCGKCPALNSSDPNDMTHWNILLKSKNYAQRPIAFAGNSWMLNHVKHSFLSDKLQIVNIGIIINEDIFTPRDKTKARTRLGIPLNGFTILARSDLEYRKGNHIFIKAVKELTESYNFNHKDFSVVTVGNSNIYNALKDVIKVYDLGYVSRDTLIDAYNACDVFVSPSLDDAGPSMINQSIMCGTPVISSDTGVAHDVVIPDMSGIIVPVGDSKAICDAIIKFKSLSKTEKVRFDQSTRKVALKHNSRQAFANAIESVYCKLCKKEPC